MTSDSQRYYHSNIINDNYNNNVYQNIYQNNDNIINAINRLINDFNRHGIINHPIEQIVSRVPVGIPVVDGYILNPSSSEDHQEAFWWFSNESDCELGEEIIPVGNPVTIGTPVYEESKWCMGRSV